MKGAVIASDATPDKNKLSTDTLTHSDIQNKADYSASSSGYNLDTVTNIKDGGKDANGKQILVAEKGLSGSPDISVPVNGSAGSTTKSAIADGTIIVRSGNTDISNLSRNTADSLNALGKIFDKKKVQEQQELTKVFGQEAYKAIGDLALNQYQKALDDAAKYKEGTPEYKEAMARADSWHDGGANKILLHAVAGGIMSDLGGSSFTSGAASAGLNEAVQNELAKIKDPGIHQLVSAAIGAVASKLVGGNAQTGAATALSGTKYNWLDHNQQQAMAKALAAAGNDSGKRLEIYSFYAALSQYNEAHYLTRDEAIEQSLLDQLHYDTADTKGGLNLTLNQITGYYQGYDLAGYYRGMLEGNKDYLPSFLDHFDYSQGQRIDMQDIYKPSSDPINANIQKANELIAANAPIMWGSDGNGGQCKYVREIREDGSYNDIRVPNQDAVTVDPEVQKAFDLQAADAQVVANSEGTKFVREWHADGTFKDYYLPNQNVAVTPTESIGNSESGNQKIITNISSSPTSTTDPTRKPDYTTGNIGLGVGSLGSVTFGLSVDRYNQTYFTVGPGAGKGWGVSGSIVYGRVVNMDPTLGTLNRANLNADDLSRYMTGGSFNTTAGALYGVGFTMPISSSPYRSIETGVYTPQVGGSFNYTWQIDDWFRFRK